jgi:peptidoglycan/LPS O-acetylase OafA/YrhL
LVGTQPAAEERAHDGAGWGHVPALDGIRGVAVVAVLLFHGGVSWARGGFLGVDVFFVLSGLLITSLLLDESRRTGAIDLLHFWSRRFRRLLPALLVVVAAAGLYGAFLAPRGSLDGLRKDAIATLFYVANWRYIQAGANYFEATAAP